MKIIGVHGAYCTPLSFNYLMKSMPFSRWSNFDYSDQYHDVEGISNQLKASIKEPAHLVGHSLGGLLALRAAAGNPKVLSVTTIASPIAGLDLGIFHIYLSGDGLIKDIRRYGKFIEDLHSMKWTQPIQHIVTTKGRNPYITEDSDGVITLTSQRNWKAGKCYELAVNHSEVLLDDRVVDLLEKIVKDTI